MKPRKHELTTVKHRSFFDDQPGPMAAIDAQRWRDFRSDYNDITKNLSPHPDFPIQLDIELQSACNYRCAFCTHGQEKVPFHQLSREQYIRIIAEAEEHGLVSIKLNGINEPLLTKNLEWYIRHARKHGVLNVYFATNGLLLTPERSKTLIAAGVSKLLISLDAVTPKTYLAIRRSKHYEKVVQNILSLLEIRKQLGRKWPKVRVNFLESEINKHELDAFIDFWDDKADMIGVQRQVAVPGSNDVIQDGEIMEQEGVFRCAFPFKQLVIGANGDILPCCTFSGKLMPIGHIDSMTLAEAWRSTLITDLRTTHKNGGYKSNPICRYCIDGK